MVDEKGCSKCGEVKPLSDFHRATRNKDGHHYWCKPCAIAARMESYRKNPRVNRKSNRRVRARNRQWMVEFLRGKCCLDCGIDDPLVLQFDHVRGQKRTHVSSMVSSYSWATIMREIEKCDIVCANCHQRRTAMRGEWYRTQV